MILLIVTVTPLDSEDVYLSLVISTVKSTAVVMRHNSADALLRTEQLAPSSPDGAPARSVLQTC